MERIRITFVAENVSARARLLVEQAPRTCEALWKQLEKPLQLRGRHSMWTGPEISLQIPPALALPELLEIPPENQTVFPLQGALLWAFLPSRVFGGMAHPLYDLGIYYAPQGRVFLPLGWVPCNHFAQLEGDWDEFREVCRRIREEGAKELRFERD